MSHAATTVQSTRQESKPRKAGASRGSKRKASAPTETKPKPESDSDQMEIDQLKAEEQDSDEAPAATPDASDDETDEQDSAAPSVREKSSETLGSSSVAQVSNNKSQSEGTPPPKRELPFGRRPATRSKQIAKQPSPTAEDDEATDEEEL
jgi:hypothetical protein